MTAAPIHLAGERLLLDPSGAVLWPDRHLLAVADLHLEKGTAMARRGQLVPPWDTRETLARLRAVLRLHRPRQVILLGDSFHDTGGPARMGAGDLALLRGLAAAHRFIWITGNHDPSAPADLPGEAAEALELDPLVFRHEARPGAVGELCGHHHPKARVATRAGPVARPCFVTDGRRLMLPAFGAYTGGLDVSHPAIAALFRRGGRVFLLGRDRLFSFDLTHAQEGGRLRA